MKRRTFLGSAIASSCLSVLHSQVEYSAHGDLVIERSVSGKPHAGKVLAAIQPHANDSPLFAAGTVAKLLDEGYTGHLIRVTNDDSAGAGTPGTVVAANE